MNVLSCSPDIRLLDRSRVPVEKYCLAYNYKDLHRKKSQEPKCERGNHNCRDFLPTDVERRVGGSESTVTSAVNQAGGERFTVKEEYCLKFYR